MSVRPLALGVLVLQAGCGCGDDDVCRVDGGRYYAMVPADWNGRTHLPVILSAHGYGGTPDSLLGRSSLGDTYDRAGVLWVVPEGEDESWSTTNSPESGDTKRRDDVAFLGKVLDDVADRWPIDRDRVAASGFSQGGSMASELACRAPHDWPVTMPISGTFWDEVPAACDGAVAVHHTHGTADNTWPLDGRPIGPFHQGAVHDAMEMWADAAGCDAEPVPEADGDHLCSVYTGCSGGDIRVCFHDGGHTILPDEASRQVAWLGSLGWW